MQTVTVVCLKVGTGLFDWSWVDKLYRGVCRSFTGPVDFYVMTDVVDPKVNYKQIQLPKLRTLRQGTKDPLWWYKLYLFSPDNPLAKKQVIYFDLDVVFIGNCDFLLDVPKDLLGVRKDFAYDIFPHKKSTNRPQGSVIVCTPNNYKYIWEKYYSQKKIVQRTYQTDQDLLAHIVPEDKFFYLDKQKVVSWKFNVLRGGMVRQLRPDDGPELRAMAMNRIIYNNVDKFYILPDNARVIIFHGKSNKPHKFMHADVVKEHWI